MPLIPLATSTAPGTEPHNGARLINYFASPSQGVTPAVLKSRGGMVQRYDLGGPVRALHSLGGKLYAAAAGKLWRLDAVGATGIGSVRDGTTTMAATRRELAIVSGGVYHLFDGTTVKEYSTGAVTNPSGVATVDGYFVIIGSSAGNEDALTISGLDNGKVFDGTEFAFAESAPDELTGILRDHDRLYLFGSETVQQFVNTGNANFPFEPVTGATAEHGCIAGTPAKAANFVYWVRPDGAVLTTGGAEPTVISPPEIQNELSRRDVTGGFTFVEQGHEFYAVVTQSGTALVYDITTQLWHERTSGLLYDPWAAMSFHQLDGVGYFGCSGGQVCTLSSEVYDDFGGVLLGGSCLEPIAAERRLFSHFQAPSKRRRRIGRRGPQPASDASNVKRRAQLGPRKVA